MCILITMVAWMCREARTCKIKIGESPISATKSNSKLEYHQFRPTITNKQVRYPHDIGLVFIYLITNNRYQYNNVAQYIFT